MLFRIIKKFLKTVHGSRKNEYGTQLQSYTEEKEFAKPARLAEIKKYLIVNFLK